MSLGTSNPIICGLKSRLNMLNSRRSEYRGNKALPSFDLLRRPRVDRRLGYDLTKVEGLALRLQSYFKGQCIVLREDI